jgi:hypothetical protein
VKKCFGRGRIEVGKFLRGLKQALVARQILEEQIRHVIRERSEK